MNSDSNIQISSEMRELIIAYMEACNSGEYAKSEGLLQKIKEQGQIDHDSRSN